MKPKVTPPPTRQAVPAWFGAAHAAAEAAAAKAPPPPPAPEWHGKAGDRAMEQGLEQDHARVGAWLLWLALALTFIGGLWLGHRAGFNAGVIEGIRVERAAR
jgi:hypothetical protein